MKTKTAFWLNTLGVAVFLIFEGYLTGCGKISGLPVAVPPSIIPGIPIAPPPPPIGVVNNSDGFYVINRTNTNYTYVGHKGNATMSTPCVAVAGELADCYIEGQELDLYYAGVDLQYNVPSSLCTYFRIAPYYYFTRPTGAGPASVQLDTDKNGVTGIDTNSDGTITGGEPVFSSVSCQYDYTPDGPNCCGGKYTLVSRTWSAALNPPTGAYQTTTTTNLSWGGSPANCFSGPAMKTQNKDPYGRPTDSLSYIGGSGVNSVYSVSAPLAAGKVGNIFVANFFDTADYLHVGTPAVNLGFPNSLNAVTVSGVSYAPNQYYDYQCLDASEELIAEIRMHVRSWTKKSNFLDLVANPGLYQISGSEPAPWNTGYDFWDRNNWHTFKTDVCTTPGAGCGFPGASE